MSNRKKTPASERAHAFRIATTDPNSAAVGVLAGREVYDRKFTLGEVQDFALAIDEGQAAKTAAGGVWMVADELEIFAGFLSRRIADDGGPIAGADLLASMTDADYAAALEHFAPSLFAAAQAAVSAGKARSNAK